MATLVSPNVSVTIIDNSVFIPASASTVPLFFIATADEKTVSSTDTTPAVGTYEHDVIRSVSSIDQMLQLYGTPRFLEDPTTGEQHHGDCRNEYGLFALYQYLGVGSRAYVIRANVNLNDNLEDIQDMWDNKIASAAQLLENAINTLMNEYNTLNNFIPSSPGYKETVTANELMSLINDIMDENVFESFSFRNCGPGFLDDHSVTPLDVYANGFDQPSTGVYEGLQWIAENIGMTSYPGGGLVPGEFTGQEGFDLLVAASVEYKFTPDFRLDVTLGANDAARRVAIVSALQASINSNTQIRSDVFDFNVVLAPGYHEVVDELVSLVVDAKEEVFVVADTPVNEDVDGTTNPSTGWAASSARIRSQHVAYYYPWALASNLDGKNVCVAPSGVAMRTIGYSDSVSEVWFAPAGLRRGLISGITMIGYVQGQLGSATTFTELNLNDGDMDSLYQYAPGGDINPLLFRPGRGFVVWGQKTSAPFASAMDRVNVSRLMKYIKRSLRRNTLSFVFQPNDVLTREDFKETINSFLSDLIVKRGLYDYVVRVDEINNSPDRIDRNEMYADIAVKPVKASEFIFIPITIVTTGAEI